MGNDICDLINRVNELQEQFYKCGAVYRSPVSGLQFIVRPDQHKILLIRGYLLLDKDGNSVYIHLRIFPNQMVEIDSNVDMTGLTLYLF
jgi:hypothetical protein